MQQPPGTPPQAPYAPGPPPAQPKSGFPVWLIVLLAVIGSAVVIGGILVALAYSGMQRYMASAKTAEAKNSVGAISRAAVAAYEREAYDVGGSGSTHRLCETAPPVPASPSAVAGKKYMPSSASGADFDWGTAEGGWKCLKFSMTMPMYYRYRYTKGSGYLVPSLAPGLDGFEASAQGDLDGDGVLSTFARTGTVRPDNTVVLATSLYTNEEFE